MSEIDKETSRSRPSVLYLVANEDITSPLLRRQVIELLAEEVALSRGTVKMKILLFQSVHSLVRRWKTLRCLKRDLKSQGIALAVIPSLTPWPIPNVRFKKTLNGYRPDGTWNRFAARCFSFYAFPFLLYHYFRARPNILHSRSYPPALAARLFQKFVPTINHVFDPRSDFPEENVVAGRWKEGSRDFKFWKSAESHILRSAQATACISEEYVAHFKKSAGYFPYFIAPNNVDTRKFIHDSSFRSTYRRELGWSEDDLVFVYLGEMSTDGWHRPEFYRRFLDVVRRQEPRAKLLMLIPAHATAVTRSCFYGVEGVVIKNPAYEDVPSWLSVADVGLMYMHRRRLAVGTKIGEYLAVGLPILCNSNCLGTKRFLTDHPRAGFVFDIGLGDDDRLVNGPAINSVAKLAKHHGDLRALAEKIFSNSAVANAYLQSYQRVLVQNRASSASW